MAMVSSSCKRVVGPGEVALGEQQLVQRRVDLDGREQIQEVGPAVGEAPRTGPGASTMGSKSTRAGARQRLALGGQGAVQVDEEVVEVEIVAQEQIVLHVGQPHRAQRRGGHRHRGVGGDERHQLRAQLEVAEDQEVGRRADERPQADVDQPVQQAREASARGTTSRNSATSTMQRAGDGPHQRQHEAAGERAGVEDQRRLGLGIERQAGIEVQRQPGVGIAQVVGDRAPGGR